MAAPLKRHNLAHKTPPRRRTNMRKSWLVGAISLAAAVIGTTASALAAAEPAGDWMVAEKTAVIRIAPCAPAQPVLCGNIVWTKGPAGTDKNNPDPAKR